MTDASQTTAALLTKDEFCARFKARMVGFLETFDDGTSVAEYADEVGPTYFEGQYLENPGDETPE